MCVWISGSLGLALFHLADDVHVRINDSCVCLWPRCSTCWGGYTKKIVRFCDRLCPGQKHFVRDAFIDAFAIYPALHGFRLRFS